MTALPKPKDLIPHKEPMLFVDDFISFDASGMGRVGIKIKKNALYMENGRFQNEWCIEIMAQAVGCLFCWSAFQEHADLNLGFLLSVDEFSLRNAKEDVIKFDDILYIDVKMDADLFPIRKYSSAIILNDKIYATSSMKFYATKDHKSINETIRKSV